jgi:hypothetical protein
MLSLRQIVINCNLNTKKDVNCKKVFDKVYKFENKRLNRINNHIQYIHTQHTKEIEILKEFGSIVFKDNENEILEPDIIEENEAFFENEIDD